MAASIPVPASAQTSIAIDPGRAARFVARLRDNQNLGGALAGGMLGAIIGAALWGVITALTNFQIGWEAVGIGLLVGLGVRTLGRGIDPLFGYVGGALALLGIALGNILAGLVVFAHGQHIPFMVLLVHLNLEASWILLRSSFGPMDLVFYALGIYYGYRYSFHRLTNKDVLMLA